MSEIIDYAAPLMNIERLAKEAHALCEDRKYEQARELAMLITAEGRILYASIRHLQEKENKDVDTKATQGGQARLPDTPAPAPAAQAQGLHGGVVSNAGYDGISYAPSNWAPLPTARDG